MTKLDNYLNYLNEDFSITNKIFNRDIVAKIVNRVKSSVKGKNVNKAVLDKALKPIPILSSEKINKALDKYLPTFKHNKKIALKHFDKKYPGKPTNDTIATATGMIASANNKYSIQDSIKHADKVYSTGYGSGGGGSFILMLLGMFLMAGAFSFEGVEFKTEALIFAVGALLIIASVKSLMS